MGDILLAWLIVGCFIGFALGVFGSLVPGPEWWRTTRGGALQICLASGLGFMVFASTASQPDPTSSTPQEVTRVEDRNTIRTKGAVGCLTEDALDEFLTAATNRDRRHGRELLASGLCFGISGQSYALLDLGFLVTEIRVFTENGSVRLFVPTEFVRE